MKKNIYGDQAGQNILLASTAYSDTTPIVATLPTTNMDTVSLVLVNTGTGHGDWKIEASNDYERPQGLANRAASTGTWGTVTTLFAPTIATVTAAIVQAARAGDWGFGAVRVTFTPSSGSGAVAIFVMCKGNN